MKKYTINISGRGSEFMCFKINSEQVKKLQDGRVEDDQMFEDEIVEVLGIQSNSGYLYTENMCNGIYEHYCHINVIDEFGKNVWESKNGFKNSPFLDSNSFDYNHFCSKEKENEIEYLIVEETLKGDFFRYNIEIEKDFEPEKFTPIITEICEMFTIFTGFKYDGKELELSELLDNWGKGIYYHLI